MTRIKICGLTNLDDLVWAVGLGADAVGFVLEPTSPRAVTIEEATGLASYAGPFVQTVAVFGRQFELAPEFGAVQAVELLPAGQTSQQRIQVFRVQPDSLPQDAWDSAAGSHALLLDTFAVGMYGGSGKPMNWEFARSVISHFTKPTILAGGLTPDNVAEAVRIVEPYAVDVSSGVESAPGRKDRAKMRDFIAAVRSVGP